MVTKTLGDIITKEKFTDGLQLKIKESKVTFEMEYYVVNLR